MKYLVSRNGRVWRLGECDHSDAGMSCPTDDGGTVLLIRESVGSDWLPVEAGTDVEARIEELAYREGFADDDWEISREISRIRDGFAPFAEDTPAPIMVRT